jgi:release factor glutamine methyltransferase
MKLEIWLNKARTKLKDGGIISWHQDAGSLAKYIFKLNDSEVILGERELSEADLAELELNLERRLKSEPLTYILNRANFYGRDFYVDERVLIPRPETESLIEFILSLNLSSPRIVDVGAGSGIIGLSLAAEIANSEIELLDVSSDALEVAKLNAKNLGSAIKSSKSKLKFKQSDLLETYGGEPADIIVANLPYVDKSWDWLDIESLEFEPDLALWTEDSGLSLIKKLLESARKHLKNGGHLVLEMDPSQKEEVLKFTKNLDWNHVKTEPKFGEYILVFRR